MNTALMPAFSILYLTSGFYTSRNNLALKRPSGVTGSDQCRVWDEEFRVTPDHNLQGAESSAAAGRWSRETLTPSIMSMLASKCPNLEELHLLCINVNGNNLRIVDALPKSITTLSIVHSNLYNLDPAQSPFFGIHQAVPNLKVN